MRSKLSSFLAKIWQRAVVKIKKKTPLARAAYRAVGLTPDFPNDAKRAVPDDVEGLIKRERGRHGGEERESSATAVRFRLVFVVLRVVVAVKGGLAAVVVAGNTNRALSGGARLSRPSHVSVANATRAARG